MWKLDNFSENKVSGCELTLNNTSNYLNEKDCTFLNLQSVNKELDESLDYANTLTKKFSEMFVVGMGGALMGAKAFLHALPPGKLHCKRVTFIDHCDESYVDNLLNQLCDIDKTCFFFISKSGETIETYSLLLYLSEKLKVISKEFSFQKNFYFVTRKKSSLIYNWFQQNNLKIVIRNNKEPGRFSLFSFANLVPVLFSGDYYSSILSGVATSAADIDKIRKISHFMLSNLINGRTIPVFFAYEMRFQFLGLWLTQLFSESLGKKNKLVKFDLPHFCIGSRDHHSIVENILTYNENKFVTMIAQSNQIKRQDCSLGAVLEGERTALFETLRRSKIPTILLKCFQINPESISELMMNYLKVVIVMGKYLKISLFEQAQIDNLKNMAKSSILNSKTEANSGHQEIE